MVAGQNRRSVRAGFLNTNPPTVKCTEGATLHPHRKYPWVQRCAFCRAATMVKCRGKCEHWQFHRRSGTKCK